MSFSCVAGRSIPLFIIAGSLMAGYEQTAEAEDSLPLQSREPSEKGQKGKKEEKRKEEVIVVKAQAAARASSLIKTNTPIIESPQTISIISRKDMEVRAVTSVAEALTYTAGVQSQPQGIDSRIDGVSIRGFGAGGFTSNNNFIDGLRLPGGGQWTSTSFDPSALEKIEILKGPSGALYGQTAPGGIVNLVTKKPTAKSKGEFFLEGTGFTGFANWQGQALADVSGPLNKDKTILGRVVALAKHGDTQVNDVSLSRYYFSPSLTWRYGRKSSWTILAQYQRDQGGSTFQFLPATGSLYPSHGHHISNSTFIGEPKWNKYDRNQALIGSFLEHRFNKFLTLRNNTRYTYIDTLNRGVVLSGDTITACPSSLQGCIPGKTVRRRGVEGRGKSQGIATDTQLEVRLRTSVVQHLFLVGTDYFYTSWIHARDAVNPAVVSPIHDIFDPVPGGSGSYGSNLIPQIYSSTVSQQNGLYFQDQIRVERLRVTIGGRQDWARDKTLDVINHKSYRIDSNKFTWRAGAVYLLPYNIAPYFSYAQSFQPEVSDPSRSLTGQPFKPTTGEQYEAGLRYQYRKVIYVTFGAYDITEKNMTIPDDNAMCGISVCLVQTGKGRVRGLELEGRVKLPWDMDVIFTGTRSDARITRTATAGEKGNYLPQAPKWMASLFLDQRIHSGLFKGLGFGGGVRYTGGSYGDTANTLSIPDYVLFDTFLRYDFGESFPRYKGLNFSVNVRNLANKRFVASCTATSACYYGEGRNMTARLEYRW